jgi:L-glutamine-phosphate cytidylyltransferase
MKALILAAGRGSRLQHQTSDRPKALACVSGSAILEYQMRALLENDIRDVAIAIGYQGDAIVQFMKTTFPDISVQYVWNRDYAETNSAYSFWLAHDAIADDAYVHLNCDIIFSPALLRRVLTSSHANCIAIRRDVTLSDGMENVKTDDERIVRMTITHEQDACGKAFGLAKFSAESTTLLSERIQRDLDHGKRKNNYYGMIRDAVGDLPYYGLDAGDDLLLEVNSLADFAAAEITLARRFPS